VPPRSIQNCQPVEAMRLLLKLCGEEEDLV